ncbi:4-alpha-glucanotransferase [Allopusillimonas ginsengisoli]|uniref:4-alpha-glucanotransferase n=1 Tax=Allopusillimonas ginsengisoli TaxID=453575 RepID=UPI0010210FC2|nr:4-alpha-glucanotransferase [Allopusillimonas ginsengisoli]TEA77584.1 4-alpha-glucanotransferase [Allopusillimonas ginsengisoli]
MGEKGSADLHRLAYAAGLTPVWQDVFGNMRQVCDDSLRSLLVAMGLPCASAAQIQDSYRLLAASEAADNVVASKRLWVIDVGQSLIIPWRDALPYQLRLESGKRIDGTAERQTHDRVCIPAINEPGYHTLCIGNACISIAVCPHCCPSVRASADAEQSRAWGIATQVYSLRSAVAANGAGDFSLLARFATQAGHVGASALAISPVHAMFTAAPERYSPYSPSSRLFLNVAYAEPELVLGRKVVACAMTDSPIASDVLRAAGWSHLADPSEARAGDKCMQADTIDWHALVPARLAILRVLFERFEEYATDTLARDFRQFCQEGGDALESHARYEALSTQYCRELGPESGWQNWPSPLHNPDGEAVRHYAQAHRAEVDFHCFTQWLADRGLANAQAAARASGMSVGLIADLAIGTDARGSHAWRRQADMLQKVSVGAPPDLFQPLGQSWGITAFSPHALRNSAYAGFVETLRANLRHAGGIRIDHVMGLARMWLVPEDAEAGDGAYLQYPFREMLGLLVLEAWRHKAIVIGENLGTVEPDFNNTLKQKGIFGTSVLWFQHDEPWPDWTMATTTTHDLPTIEGWWRGRDIQWQAQLGQLSAEQAETQRQLRAAEKTALLSRLPSYRAQDAGENVAPRQAILEYVAATPSPLVMIPIEDILGVLEQPNLPGTVAVSALPSFSMRVLSPLPAFVQTVSSMAGAAAPDSHPSWIQRLPQPVCRVFDQADSQKSLASIIQGRSG